MDDGVQPVRRLGYSNSTNAISTNGNADGG